MKKFLIFALCAILALACMFACGNETKDNEPTKAPEATEAPAATDAQPTEAPAATDAQPTEAPAATEDAQATEAPAATDAQASADPAEATEAPAKVEKMNVDGIVTDMSEEIPVDQFTVQNGAQFAYVDGYAFASILNEGSNSDAYVSFRLWDPRYIEEGTGIVADDATDRTLADPAAHPFYAIKYRVTGEEVTAKEYNVGSWEGNVITAPSDVIAYEDHALTCDNEWHTVIIDLAAECPTLCSQCEGGADALDCVIFSAPADGESTIDIAWYGAFKSVDEINAWDANYAALNSDEVSVSK